MLLSYHWLSFPLTTFIHLIFSIQHAEIGGVYTEALEGLSGGSTRKHLGMKKEKASKEKNNDQEILASTNCWYLYVVSFLQILDNCYFSCLQEKTLSSSIYLWNGIACKV